MASKGGVRPGAGRKTKADEQRIRDLTSPYVSGAIEKVVYIMNNADKASDQLSAAKLLLEYHFGKPKQSTDITSGGETIKNVVSLGAGLEPKEDVRDAGVIEAGDDKTVRKTA